MKKQNKDMFARMDMVLVVDKHDEDTGEYFVKVGLWSDEAEDYEMVNDPRPNHDVIAAVSKKDVAEFLLGITPPAVKRLIARFQKTETPGFPGAL